MISRIPQVGTGVKYGEISRPMPPIGTHRPPGEPPATESVSKAINEDHDRLKQPINGISEISDHIRRTWREIDGAIAKAEREVSLQELLKASKSLSEVDITTKIVLSTANQCTKGIMSVIQQQ